MADRIVITIMNRRWFSGHARPSDTGVPYAESVTVATDMLRRGVPKVQIDYDLSAAREVKWNLIDAGVIV